MLEASNVSPCQTPIFTGRTEHNIRLFNKCTRPDKHEFLILFEGHTVSDSKQSL
ncbi:uncharacterized protein PHALS_00938 [Plasmopara halstedii]|uniref:Uncharacterized protein n=1 Tax=Plasmopara halstedii TaxID=4781 RepID=A0A0P1ATQ0_PLAHL|nr:uncharacterized protein PHALS_00938 [Plasmopara halstedii]CEG44588.1 hypothetical protein PHALS_00938 [Plasmopara halstedii]|eukprot:XP_024580957.1 hypothetical protein PHALS_00938 [Plasmopara halstedii]